MAQPQIPQLLSARETELVELFRRSCPEHQDTIAYLANALSKRCAAAHKTNLAPFIRTSA